MAPLRVALERGAVSIRGADRCLRVAWTLADLAGRMSPTVEDVSAALSFRQAGGLG
jgi:magnesium chelatase family protein